MLHTMYILSVSFMLSQDWTKLFVVEAIELPYHINVDHGECNANCLEAKELVCVCKCGGLNHGRNLKLGMKPLTEFVEPEIGLDDYSMVY